MHKGCCKMRTMGSHMSFERTFTLPKSKKSAKEKKKRKKRKQFLESFIIKELINNSSQPREGQVLLLRQIPFNIHQTPPNQEKAKSFSFAKSPSISTKQTNKSLITHKRIFASSRLLRVKMDTNYSIVETSWVWIKMD